jgi:hypothetical protein
MSRNDFLNRSATPAILPTATGGGSFVSSIVGLFSACLFLQVLAEDGTPADETVKDGLKLLGVQPQAVNNMGGWNSYFFREEDYDAAAQIQKEINPDFKSPTKVWLLQTYMQDVLNIEDKSNWGNVFMATTNVKSYRSPARHELHMISLPAAVAAYAEYMGYANSGFDLTELTDAEEEDFDNEWYSAYLIGHPKSKKEHYNAFEVAEDTARAKYGDGAAEIVRRLVTNMDSLPVPNDVPEPVVAMAKDVEYIPWRKSLLWERRSRLWASLGEENADLFQPIGALTPKGKESKFACVNPSKLEQCLGVLAYPWTEPVWARVTNVYNPGPGKVSKSGGRLTVPAIVQFFGDKGEAQSDAEREIAERNSDGEAPVATPAQTPTPTPAQTPAPAQTPVPALPPVPAAWMNAETPLLDAWKENMRGLKAKYPGPKEVFAIQVQNAEAAGTLAAEHACSAQEAIDWYEFA